MSDPIDDDQELSNEDQDVWDEYVDKDISPSPSPDEIFSSLLEAEGKFSDDSEIEESFAEETIIKDISPKVRNNDDLNFQMDRSTEEKLRKGKIPIEGRIDLHGMTQDKAYEALTHFIDDALLKQKRCLLVITGKGKSKSTSEDWLKPGQGILKKRVPEWLFQSHFNQSILKIFSAQPKHGGSGALYVYLRRQR